MARIGFGQFGKLRLGFLDTSIATFSSIGLNPGTLVNSGISFFGGSLQVGVARAAVNIGPPVSIPGLTLPFSLEVAGISNFVGNTNQLGLYTCNGASIFNGTQTTNGVNTVNAASIFNGAVTVNGATIINGAETVNGAFVALNATINPQAWKGFDVNHPNKVRHRLRHICLEGPEAGVYIRGKSKNSVIELPDYWINFIDPESITVTLTSIGLYQKLYVEKIEDNKVYVSGGFILNGETLYNYHYMIHASRIDGEPLIVEYEGETPADYPGGPDQFSIAGYDYGRNIQ